MKKITAAFGALTLLISSAGVNAGLMMNITDSGGLAQFSLSGSDSVISGSEGLNGVWVHGATVTSMFAVVPTSTTHNVSSGSGEITNTLMGSANIVGLYTDVGGSCCNFGVMNGSGGYLAVGDIISWSGSFTTDLMYNVFNAGSYYFDTLVSGSFGGVGLKDGITINVAAIPEPSIIALFGLGLVGIGFARRRRS